MITFWGLPDLAIHIIFVKYFLELERTTLKSVYAETDTAMEWEDVLMRKISTIRMTCKHKMVEPVGTSNLYIWALVYAEKLRSFQDPNKQEQGLDFLQLAAAGKSLRLVNLLLKSEMDFNKRTNDGKTPLFRVQLPAIANALCDKGADPFAVDNNGDLAFYHMLLDHEFWPVASTILLYCYQITGADTMDPEITEITKDTKKAWIKMYLRCRYIRDVTRDMDKNRAEADKYDEKLYIKAEVADTMLDYIESIFEELFPKADNEFKLHDHVPLDTLLYTFYQPKQQ
jgi:hypothetical protein